MYLKCIGVSRITLCCSLPTSSVLYVNIHNSASPVFHPTYLSSTHAQYTYIYTYIHHAQKLYAHACMYIERANKLPALASPAHTHPHMYIHEHPANQPFHSRKSKHAQASMTLGDMLHRGGRSPPPLPCPFPFPE